MKSFIELARFYASYHQNLTTRYTHMIGIPLIVFSLMILLGFVKILIPNVVETNLACFATLILMVYYFLLNWQLSLALTPIMVFLLWLASWFSYAGPTKTGLWVFIITFVIGWALQLYGHLIEGKKPAFMDNIYQALIAPLYLMAEGFFAIGYMKSLHEQIYGATEKSQSSDES